MFFAGDEGLRVPYEVYSAPANAKVRIYVDGGAYPTNSSNIVILPDGTPQAGEDTYFTVVVYSQAPEIVHTITFNLVSDAGTLFGTDSVTFQIARTRGCASGSAGRYTGAAFVPFDFLVGGGEDLVVLVDGDEQTIALGASLPTAAAAAAAMQALTGARVSVLGAPPDEVIVIESLSSGAGSTVTLKPSGLSGSGMNALALFGADTSAVGGLAQTGVYRSNCGGNGVCHQVSYIRDCPMPIQVLHCRVSKLVNSEACPSHDTGLLRVLRRLGRRGLLDRGGRPRGGLVRRAQAGRVQRRGLAHGLQGGLRVRQRGAGASSINHSCILRLYS
jgi:hypothetical protein